MDSREKVLHLKDYLLSLTPEDEEMAQQLQLAASFAPVVVKLIPQDPVEVDRYLRMTAWAAAKCRSDDAPALGVFELVDGEWVPVEVAMEGAS
jgi:hypothetical protein